jgi:hypothetical protein
MKKWTKKEIEFLKENYSSNPNIRKVASKLSRSIRAIQHKAAREGFSRPRFPSNKPIKRTPRKIIGKRYYEKNKEKILKRRKERAKKLKKELRDMLGGKCSKCGYKKFPGALDFHHIEGNKEGMVSLLIKDDSKQKALKEMKKCILLCANCHREAHIKGL